MTAAASDWQAEAYFSLGEDAQRAGDHQAAAGWYRRAHELAAEDEPTLFNLAVTLIRLNQPLEALAILDRLGDRLEGDGEARPMRASVAYNRGLALCLSGDEAKGRTIVADLVSEVLVALEKSRDDDERRFLGRLEGPATALLARLVDGTGGEAEATMTRGDAEPRAILPLLTRVEERSPALAAQLEGLARDRHEDDPPTAYNLACLLTRRGQLGAALDDLRRASRDPALRAWAAIDPSLAALSVAEPQGFTEALEERRLRIPPAVRNSARSARRVIRMANRAQPEDVDGTPARSVDPEFSVAPDPDAAAAFALGWHVARLGAAQQRTELTVENDVASRFELSLAAAQGAIARLTDRFEAAQVGLPNFLLERFSGFDTAASAGDVDASFVTALTRVDTRLAKAYSLAQSLTQLASAAGPEQLNAMWKGPAILRAAELLTDLEATLPRHSARAVALSLERWGDWLDHAHRPDDPGTVLRCVERQGERWRTLLTGELPAADTLRAEDYLEASNTLLRQDRVLRRRALATGRYGAAIATTLAVAGLILAIALDDRGAELAGTALSVLAAIAGWRLLASSLAEVRPRVRAPLWSAALEEASAHAITVLPDGTSGTTRGDFE